MLASRRALSLLRLPTQRVAATTFQDRTFNQRREYAGMFDSIMDVVNKAGGANKIKEMMTKTYEGESKNGLVKISLRGDDTIQKVSVEPELLQRSTTIVENSIEEALSSAVRQKQAAMIQDWMKGGGPPGGFGNMPVPR